MYNCYVNEITPELKYVANSLIDAMDWCYGWNRQHNVIFNKETHVFWTKNIG